jgi:tetratricopeptide (TPR) repeat protein
VEALKLLSSRHRKNRDVYARFKKEAEILSSLNHRCIPVIYEINEFRNRPFITMEFLTGKSLMDITEYKILSLARILDIAHEVISGLKVAHARGIIHRDLKLSNIMITDTGEVKLIDFGLAASGWLTPEEDKGLIIGTIPYMSPEQTRGEQLDHRSDIFSLGICLYELISGRLPFFDPDADEVLRRVQEEKPRSLREHRPDAPEELETGIFQCIEKEPDRRFQSLDDLSSVLRQVEGLLKERKEEEVISESARDRMESLTLDMVNREDEYTELTQAYFRALSGKGCAVFIQGEAGIGKTRLIEELTKHCDAAEVHVASGQAHPGMSLPYRPVAEAIRYLMLAHDVVTDREAEAFIDEQYGHASMQGRILKSFLVQKPSRNLEIAGRENLFDTVSDLLAGFARHAPLVMVLENMHWADKATLDLLIHLTGAIQGRKILLILSYRPDEPGSETDFPLNHFAAIALEKQKTGDVMLVRLTRLNAKDTQSLVNFYLPGNRFSSAFHKRVFDKSDGNPLFTLELLKHFTRLGHVVKTKSGWMEKKGDEEFPVPTRIHDLLSRRLGALNEKEMQVLEAAAVEGESFTSESVGVLTRMDRLAVLNMLRSLWRQQLIQLTGDSYRFNPSLVREVLYRQMMPELKQEYHRLLAALYVESPPPGKGNPAEVARHYHRGGDTERAMEYYMEAGYAALNLHADAEALASFDCALNLVENNPLGAGGKHTLDIQLNRSEIFTRRGEPEKAAEAANEALALGKAMAIQEEMGQALRLKGKICHLAGDSEKALKHLERGLGMVKEPSSRAEILNLLGLTAENRGDHAQAMRCFSESLNLSHAAGNRLRMAQTLNHIGRTLLNKGDPGEALIRFRKALDITVEIGDRRGMAVNTNNVGILLRRMDRLQDSLKLLFRSARIFKAIRYPNGTANTLWNIGVVFRAMGDRKKAEKFVVKANNIFERIASHHGHALCRLSLGNLYAAAGEVDRAMEHIAASLETARKIEYPRIVAYGLASRGSLELALGFTDQAIASLKSAQEAGSECQDVILTATILGQLGLAQCLSRRDADGLNMAQGARAAAELSRDPSVLSDTHFLLCRVLLITGDTELAEKSFVKASTYLSRNARPARKAELHFASGLVDLSRNRPLQAQRKFQTALALQEKLDQPLKVLECLHGLVAATVALKSHDRLSRIESMRKALIDRICLRISSTKRQALFRRFHARGGALAVWPDESA